MKGAFARLRKAESRAALGVGAHLVCALGSGAAFEGAHQVRSYKRPEIAFTLIEVLVSLAIFALAAVVLSVAYLNIIGSYRSLGAYHRGEEDWKLLRTVVLTEAELPKVEQGGHLSLPAGRQLDWTAKVAPTEVADLFRLTLTAESPATGGSDAWRHQQVIHVLRPSWSDPGEREKLRENTRQRLAKEPRQ